MAFLIGGLLLIFAIVCGFVGAYFCSECDGDKPAVGAAGWVLCVLLAIAFILVPFSMHQVDESEVCVVKQFGEVKEVVTKPGMFFDIWVGKSYKRIDTKTQDLVIEAMTYSSDAQVMTIALTFQYNILGGEAKSIIKEFGNEKALTERITSVLTETPKAVLSTRTAMDIIANRGAITPEITEAAKIAVADKYPIEITTVAISNIDFSDAFEQAVEEKMIAEQNKLKADYENEKKIATAEAEAKVKVATAKANAEAKKIEAEGEAEANKLLKQSLTPEVLRKQYLDKWDGKLPTTMTGADTSIMIPAA
jgi:regulator of protease activity HflC (stomatin/prohibitin superfamily)